MKVLFDTNVYVSEALVGGLAEEMINAAVDARFRIFVSPYILDGMRRVLVEKLGFAPRFAALARERVRRRCEPIDPPASRHHVAADPSNSSILTAAVAAGADYLVTNDRHLLKLDPYEGIQIITMQAFAAKLRNDGLLQPR